MEGIYKIDKDKIEQYSAATSVGKAKVFGIIMLVFVVGIFVNSEKDNWRELETTFILFCLLLVLVVAGYLFIKPPALNTIIELRSDRILNTRYGFTIEMNYTDLGRFIKDDTGLLILQKGLKGEVNYFTSKRLKTTDQRVIFIPCAIEKYTEICAFLKSKKSS